ncbi:MFS transporter [Nonomuraea africana]|uniref:MFS family arabinose efflux permease n=1 Tax=Nonomuraea africana TaxID=46171 RepID=A0ABR9KMY7_9ACTN|nr:MFS transporter [Nonomuraea africana]MBE1562917.1 putative MFS family arabinose efflux permease [Nonomuraea africana]
MTTTETARVPWAAVSTVAVGTFTIVTSEMLPVGLLTPIGSTLGVSDGVAGLTMSAPGVVAALSAPLLTVVAGRLDRRIVLIALMALLAGANLLAAYSPTYAVMLVARVLVGVSIGGFWAFAATLPARLMPERHVGRAAAMIAGGVSVASVLGVPAGTLILSLAGWRMAFVAVAVLAVVVLAALALLLPPLPATQAVRPAQLLAVWRDSALRTALVATALVVTGHFAAYTYIRPFLEQVSGAGPALISGLLLAYGVAGVLGNFGSGGQAARGPRQVMVVLAVLIAVSTMGMPLVGAAMLLLWGVSYGGVSVTGQLWVVRAGGGEAGMAMLSSVFNAAIALGALLGGTIVDAASPSAVMWFGAALALLTAAYAGTWGRRTTTGS